MFRLSIFIVLVFAAVFGVATAHAAPQEIPAAFTLGQAQVEEAVAKELMKQGVAEHIRADVMGGKTGIYYEGTQHVTPQITGLTFDKPTGRFTANLVVMSGEKALSAAPISGRFQEMISLPVLRRQMRSGEQISAADIDVADFPVMRTRPDLVTDSALMIGQSPRGSISPNRPVRVGELSSPAAIKKNAVVVMRYKSNTMEIITSGQAMMNGAPGDVIQVKNLLSQQTVRAVVENSGSVTVTPLTTTAQLTGDANAATN